MLIEVRRSEHNVTMIAINKTNFFLNLFKNQLKFFNSNNLRFHSSVYVIKHIST